MTKENISNISEYRVVAKHLVKKILLPCFVAFALGQKYTNDCKGPSWPAVVLDWD